MADDDDNSWPPLGEGGYDDEYGPIEPEVYRAAGAIWKKAHELAVATLGDGAAGRTLLAKAAANVSRVYAVRQSQLKNLNAYLFQSYKHLILAELRRERLHKELIADADLAWLDSSKDSAEQLDNKILAEQLLRSADDWTRKVFAWLALGYSFDEIGRELGMRGASVRNKFNKQLKALSERWHGGGLPHDEDDHNPRH